MELKLTAIALLLSLPLTAGAADIVSSKTGIWSIAPTATTQRWVVIHNLQEATASGIYHIEVLGRNNGDAVWQIQHLVPHMAITREALERSVIKPLTKGAVYPESYDNAYSQWLKANAGHGGAICKTSVLECMQTPTSAPAPGRAP